MFCFFVKSNTLDRDKKKKKSINDSDTGTISAIEKETTRKEKGKMMALREEFPYVYIRKDLFLWIVFGDRT